MVTKPYAASRVVQGRRQAVRGLRERAAARSDVGSATAAAAQEF